MISELETFSLADPVFFDSERRWQDDRSLFSQTEGPVPDGWQRIAGELWVELTPENHQWPSQGWKIHISACMDNAARVLQAAYDYCVDQRVPFKFLRSRNVFRAHNLKYAERSSSGKLVTIYPSDEAQLQTILEELSAKLAGEPGPYILSDLRYGDGPLYVRYGGFALRFCPGATGEPVPAIEAPDGTLVPDRREPAFTVPEWVKIPDFLQSHLAARQADEVDFPYQVENALHFSNGGGVYQARRLSDGRQVVLKEARPHAGIDLLGQDAIARLRIERDALATLKGIPAVPELYEYRTVWEHEFLVQEYREGQSLFGWLAEHHPLVTAEPTEEELRAYTARALDVVGQLTEAIQAIHERGMIMGDLHPNNILIDEADRISLIDFEAASSVEAGTVHHMGFPGFKSPNKVGAASDWHSVAVIKLWIFMPLIELAGLVAEKLDYLIDEAERRFSLPAGYADELRAELLTDRSTVTPPTLSATPEVELDSPEPNWTAIRKSLTEAILLSATPERDDRLFPGDVQQFRHSGSGLGFGYGAAGVLWALDVGGGGRYPQHEQWLVDTVTRTKVERPGFFDGQYGLAYVLDHFGHAEAATEQLEQALSKTRQLQSVNLHSGLAGAGLTLLHFGASRDDRQYLDEARQVADRITAAVRSDEAHNIDHVVGPNGVILQQLGSQGGLLRGWSGPALFLLRLYEHTGDSGYLDVAVEALHRDLRLCHPARDGSLQVNVGYAVLPYLNIGSAGIALVAAEALRHRADEQLAEALPLLVRGCQPELVYEPHLFTGRAGLLATLARVAHLRSDLDLTGAIDRHLTRLSWHALAYRGQVTFPGTKLRRLSMDLGTGNAGVLLAITAAVDRQTSFLPFLEQPALPVTA